MRARWRLSTSPLPAPWGRARPRATAKIEGAGSTDGLVRHMRWLSTLVEEGTIEQQDVKISWTVLKIVVEEGGFSAVGGAHFASRFVETGLIHKALAAKSGLNTLTTSIVLSDGFNSESGAAAGEPAKAHHEHRRAHPRQARPGGALGLSRGVGPGRGCGGGRG